MFRCILWRKTFFKIIIIKVYRILEYAAVAHFSNFLPSVLRKHCCCMQKFPTVHTIDWHWRLLMQNTTPINTKILFQVLSGRQTLKFIKKKQKNKNLKPQNHCVNIKNPFCAPPLLTCHRWYSTCSSRIANTWSPLTESGLISLARGVVSPFKRTKNLF